MQALLGLAAMGDAAIPISLDNLLPVLKRRNQLELQRRLGATIGSVSCVRLRQIQPQHKTRLNWQCFGASNNHQSAKHCNNSLSPGPWKPCRGAVENPSNTCSQGQQDWQFDRGCFRVGTQGASLASSCATGLGRLGHRGNGIQLGGHFRVNIFR